MNNNKTPQKYSQMVTSCVPMSLASLAFILIIIIIKKVTEASESKLLQCTNITVRWTRLQKDTKFIPPKREQNLNLNSKDSLLKVYI